ncbi:aspartate/glutamate racemase family protein [Sphingobium sp. MK2]|uniref:aspartate/glutamate racemase family protein n=1 Tax=Sphingobium sp. MK2 TaxID=3116540 RepID=UPI0032E36773
MDIIVTSVGAARKNGPEGDFIRQVIAPITERNLSLGTSAQTRFVQRWSEEGETHPAFASCVHLSRLAGDYIYPAMKGADEQGFDAAIVGCFGDPQLDQCEAGLSIPVIGFGKAGMAAAAELGKRIGIVTPAPMLIEPTFRQAADYGYGEMVIDVIATPETAAEQEEAVVNAGPSIKIFHELARKLIAKGADVILPGCGLQSPALRLAPGVEDEWPGGVRHIDGVPVVDLLGVVGLYAERAAMIQHMHGRGCNGVKAVPLSAGFWES